jgi:peptidoglycan/LPS O-acetylase OafA/YrhL
MKHYPFLDIIRALAIICILFVHLPYLGWVETPHWFEIGKIGVPLFFMLSSYTLCLSQSQRSESSRGAFFLRRFFRIYPLFLLLIVYIFFLQHIDSFFELAKFDHYSRHAYLSKMTMTYGLFPSFANNFFLGEWTLSNEIFFYLIFPFLFPFAKKNWKNAVLLFVLSLIIHYAWRYGWGIYKSSIVPLTWYIYDYEFQPFFYHGIDFAAGFLLFHLHQIFYDTPWKFRQKSLLGGLVLGVLAYFAYLRYFDIQLIHRQVVVLLMGFCVWIMQIRTVFTGWIDRILQYIAKVSYSIYLTNLPIMVLIYHYAKEYSSRQKLCIFFVMLAGVTFLTFQYEQWGVKIGKKVIGMVK